MISAGHRDIDALLSHLFDGAAHTNRYEAGVGGGSLGNLYLTWTFNSVMREIKLRNEERHKLDERGTGVATAHDSIDDAIVALVHQTKRRMCPDAPIDEGRLRAAVEARRVELETWHTTHQVRDHLGKVKSTPPPTHEERAAIEGQRLTVALTAQAALCGQSVAGMLLGDE